jgi:biopolymer transport protein ExbD
MAASSTSADEDEMISGINVTPLVDVTLVLLIIFMVTTSYIVRQSIDVNLPRAANGGETVGQTMMVVIHADGSLFIDGAPMDETQLLARARQAKAKDPEAKAMIAADTDARHGAVIHVIDVLKGEGINKFGLNIEKEATETPSGADADRKPDRDDDDDDHRRGESR